jgi:hypothetical protein
MGETSAPPARDRRLRPRAFFLGAAAAFAACCLAGRAVGRRPLLAGVERFHAFVAPQTLFYPTARQIRGLGKARLDPGKVVVVVGSNSVLYGVGQSPGGVWTRRLQEELGDAYQVVNLALPSGQPHEFGAVAAEIFAARCPKVILVTSTLPGQKAPAVDGLIYRYFFWDAYYKGMLRPDPDRDAALAQEAGRPPREPPFRVSPVGEELRLEMRLDSALSFGDLWNGLAYTTAHTAWNRLAPGTWYRRRRAYADPGGEVPPADRYPAATNAEVLRTLRSWLAEVDGGADPASPYWDDLTQSWRQAFPAPRRARTLFLVLPASPHYLRQFGPRERADYEAVVGLTARSLRRAGFTSAAVCEGFGEADYCDALHLSEAGGRRLAAEVAPLVRRLAADPGGDP